MREPTWIHLNLPYFVNKLVLHRYREVLGIKLYLYIFKIVAFNFCFCLNRKLTLRFNYIFVLQELKNFYAFQMRESKRDSKLFVFWFHYHVYICYITLLDKNYIVMYQIYQVIILCLHEFFLSRNCWIAQEVWRG